MSDIGFACPPPPVETTRGVAPRGVARRRGRRPVAGRRRGRGQHGERRRARGGAWLRRGRTRGRLRPGRGGGAGGDTRGRRGGGGALRAVPCGQEAFRNADRATPRHAGRRFPKCGLHSVHIAQVRPIPGPLWVERGRARSKSGPLCGFGVARIRPDSCVWPSSSKSVLESTKVGLKSSKPVTNPNGVGQTLCLDLTKVGPNSSEAVANLSNAGQDGQGNHHIRSVPEH